jgi:hypothetical protein
MRILMENGSIPGTIMPEGLKNFFRRLHNERSRLDCDDESTRSSDWITPSFASIKEKKVKR